MIKINKSSQMKGCGVLAPILPTFSPMKQATEYEIS